MPKPGIFKRIGDTDKLTTAKDLTSAVNENTQQINILKENTTDIGYSKYLLGNSDVADANDLPEGRYTANCTINRPNTMHAWFTYETWRNKTNGNTIQFAYVDNLKNYHFLRHRYNGAWSNWSEIATTDKIDISLVNGWSPAGDFRQCVSVSGNVCNLTLYMGGGTASIGTVICNIPAQVRPSRGTIHPCVNMTNNTQHYIKIMPNGDVLIDGKVMNSNGVTVVNAIYTL